jgi:hypothetical protein
MAYPTAVNNQITDEITQNNVSNVGQAPAVAMGGLYQSMAQASEMAAQNQVMAQKNAQTTASAATTLAVNSILRVKLGSGE